MEDCLFCRIIAGKIPSKKVYEDDKVFAFEDIDPKAPTHVLIIPKQHIVGLKEAMPEDAEIIGYCTSGGGEDWPRTRHRGRISHGVQRRPAFRTVGVPPAPAFAWRTGHDVATRVGKLWIMASG